jgi:hypothetical protein
MTDPNNKQFRLGWNAGIDKAMKFLEVTPCSIHHTPDQRHLCARCKNIDWLKAQKLEDGTPDPGGAYILSLLAAVK